MLSVPGRLDCRGSVAVEFALMASLLLVPLLAGGADFVEILSAQAQLNTSLQSLYYFAYTNPGQASNTTEAGQVVGKINAHATHQVSFPATTSGGSANGGLSYKCINSSGATTAPGASGCGTGYTQQTFVSYQVTGSINLTLPLPFGFTNPFPLSASGMVQIQ